MQSELAKIVEDMRRAQIASNQIYQKRNKESSQEMLLGYVLEVTEQDRQSMQYTVMVPDREQAIYRNVPVMVEMASGNNVGYMPYPYKWGDHVMLIFPDGSPDRPMILGTRYASGKPANFRNDQFPKSGKQEGERGELIVPPQTHFQVAGNFDGRFMGHPIRLSPTETTIGNIEWSDTRGNVANVTLGRNFKISTGNNFEYEIGSNESLTNSIGRESAFQVENAQQEIKQAEERQQRDSNVANLSPEEKEKLLKDMSLVGLATLLAAVEAMHESGKAQEKQQSFLERAILPCFKELEFTWTGSIVGAFSCNLGRIIVEGSGPVIGSKSAAAGYSVPPWVLMPAMLVPGLINADCKSSAELNFDIKFSIAICCGENGLPFINLGGGLNINMNTASSGAIIPLRTGGSLTVSSKRSNPVDQRATIKNRTPNLPPVNLAEPGVPPEQLQYRDIELNQNLAAHPSSTLKSVPFAMVRRKSNPGINDNDKESFALASLLTTYGIERSGLLVKSLREFAATNSIFALLTAMSLFVEPQQRLVISLARVRFGESPAQVKRFLKEITSTSRTTVGCQVISPQIENVINAAADDDAAIENIIQQAFSSPELTGVSNWLVSSSNLVDWLSVTNSNWDYPVELLVEGKFFEFFLELIRRTNGSDLSLVSQQYYELKRSTSRGLALPPTEFSSDLSQTMQFFTDSKLFY